MKPKTQEPTKTIGIKVPKPLAERLESIARRGNTSKCAILNVMIKSFIDIKKKPILSPHLRRLKVLFDKSKSEGLYKNHEANKVTINTKLEKTYFFQLEEIIKEGNTNKNAFLLELLSSVLKFADGEEDAGEINEEIEREIAAYKKRLKSSLARNRKKKQRERKRAEPAERCGMAIYFLKDKEEKPYAVYVEEPGQESKKPKIIYSAQRILKKVIDICLPSLAKRLKKIEEHTDTNNYIETITALLESEEDKAESRYIEELFSDNNKDEFGHSLTPIKYVRHNKKNPYLERKTVATREANGQIKKVSKDTTYKRLTSSML